MAELINYQADIFCPVAECKITVLFGEKDYGDNSKTEFKKVLCPYLKTTAFKGVRCNKNDEECGVHLGSLQ